MANINKQHFLLAGSCVGVRSVFSRSSLGGRRQGIRGVKERGILRKVLFREKAPEYHLGAINKEKHLQGRCCDQWAQKCFGSRFAFSKQVAMNDAYVIRRLLLPLSPKIENLWGPHIQNNAERTQEFLPHANGVSGL